MKKLILTVFACASLTSAGHAVMIASESFQTTTTGTNGTYIAGSMNGSGVIVGNTGFSGTSTWDANTGSVSAQTASLTGSLVPGTLQSGSVLFKTLAASGSGVNRNGHRLLAATPITSPSYFLSGLVQGINTTALTDGAAVAAGFMPTISTNTFSIATGIHFGIHRTGTDNFLAAFAGGNTYNLLNINATITSTYQVVLRLDVNASGNETLTAWYGTSDASDLTLGLAATDIGSFWTSAADIDTFVLQVRNPNNSSASVANFDEMRFGTTMADVTTVPEPSCVALIAGGLTALVAFRRKRAN